VVSISPFQDICFSSAIDQVIWLLYMAGVPVLYGILI